MSSSTGTGYSSQRPARGIADELCDRSYVRAWNQHDPAAMARLFHEDASFVTVLGSHLRGREEIRRYHQRLHARPYRYSSLRLVLDDGREVRPGLILAHVFSQIEGACGLLGPTRHGVMTLIVEQRHQLWKMAAAHTTFAADGRPVFPRF